MELRSPGLSDISALKNVCFIIHYAASPAVRGLVLPFLLQQVLTVGSASWSVRSKDLTGAPILATNLAILVLVTLASKSSVSG